MQDIVYYLIGATLLLSIGYIYLQPFQSNETLKTEETSANFSNQELDNLRLLVALAAQYQPYNRQACVKFINDNMQQYFGSWWSVTIFDSVDLNAKFYMTGSYDINHQNKKYFLQKNTPYGFSIYILENNNTRPNSQDETGSIVQSQSIQNKHASNLRYSKNKSPYVTLAQQKGIDLAITTAYTWNKNIISFSKNFQDLVQTNLNEHWQVCTRYQALPNYWYSYKSQYEQWIEYGSYGIGSNVWHIYIWRNYIAG